MKLLKEKISDDKGFALPVVIITLAVLGILIVSLAFMSASNTRQVITQEKNLKALYLARSGLEIAYAALMEEYEGETLFSTFVSPGGRNNDRYRDNNPLTDEIDMQDGTTEISIYLDDSQEWLTIKATGQLDEGVGGAVMYLDIGVSDPTNLIWRRSQESEGGG